MNPGYLDGYVEVKDRLPIFWDRFIEGRLETDLVFWDDRGICVKAFLYDGERLMSTGYAHEVPGQGSVNRTSALENCETSAVGRALANLDIRGPVGDEPRPSREEMVKSHRLAEPDEPRPMTGVATEKQVGLIKKLMKSSALTDSERDSLNKRVDRGLTKDEASKAIDWLQEKIDAAKATGGYPTDDGEEPPSLEEMAAATERRQGDTS
jgi:hypothetical protein